MGLVGSVLAAGLIAGGCSGGEDVGTNTNSLNTPPGGGPVINPGFNTAGMSSIAPPPVGSGGAGSPGGTAGAGTNNDVMTPSVPSVCGIGQMQCAGACIDTNGDFFNCGSCGNACQSGASCINGSCQCSAGQTSCGTGCRDTSNDANNCGNCGNVCSTGQQCAQFTCNCQQGLQDCGSGCVDPQSNSANCGFCGNACQQGQVCSFGQCAANCAGGQMNCNGSCVDVNNSTLNCGFCGNACAAGLFCQNGQCSCPVGQTSCNGQCVDTQNDASNCSSCGNACQNGATCSNGQCQGGNPSNGNGDSVTPVQNGQNGFATRYWDCCKQHCAVPANVGGANMPLMSCNQANQSLGTDFDAQSSCVSNQANSAYTCFSMAPFAVSDTLSYGFAAVPRQGDICGACFQLDFTGGDNPGAQALAGKSMVVQALNIGNDVQGGQFDLLIPGGGVGQFNACSTQWGASANELGEQFGGLLFTCRQQVGFNASLRQVKDCYTQACNSLFDTPALAELRTSCAWFVDWFEAADNPTLVYQEVPCPQAIINVSGVSR